MNKELKQFTLRISVDTWKFLKKASYEQNMSINSIIHYCIEKHKKKFENNKLTDDEGMIS